MNPYETLGVEADATPEQIKQAYRRQARIHHPDAGGEHDAFVALSLAYDILSDPARRAHYDQHGTTRASGPTPETMAQQEIISIFLQLAEQHQWTEQPYIALIRQRIKQSRREAQQHIGNLTLKRAHLTAFKFPAHSHAGESIFEIVVEGQKAHVEGKVAEINALIEQMDCALDLLKGYKDNEVAMLGVGMGAYTQGTSTSGVY